MIKLELTFSSLDELREFLGKERTEQTTPATEEPQEPRMPEVEASAWVEEIAPPEAVEEGPEPTFQEVKEAVLALAMRSCRDAAVGLMSKFGVAQLRDLDRTQWANIKREAEQ